LFFRMVVENPTWGAPRIHGELRMLGFDLSERTVSRWMKRAPIDPDRAKRWLAFLRNHREAIAAMDFFTVPTISFGVLYCFFVISHDRRRILHVNVTKHPTSGWIYVSSTRTPVRPLPESSCYIELIIVFTPTPSRQSKILFLRRRLVGGVRQRTLR
jgi:hypothetical protein